jgi:hypothetical protein
MFDHRFATFEGTSERDQIAGHPRGVLAKEKSATEFTVLPRYFVRNDLVRDLFEKYASYQRKWLLVWRDVARATDERTCIASVIPKLPASVKCPGIGFDGELNGSLLLGNLNSMVLDYVARQKIGGISLSFFIFKQLPVLAPSQYLQEDDGYVTQRVLELVYTASDLRDYAIDMGYSDDPFPWAEERRAVVRAELDAYYAHLYGLTREEILYILDPKDVFGSDYPS